MNVSQYCIRLLSESDSLHEDRRAGLLPEMEVEEESSKNDPPSNGTVVACLAKLNQNIITLWGFTC